MLGFDSPILDLINMNLAEQLKQSIVEKLDEIERIEQEVFRLQQALEIIEGSGGPEGTVRDNPPVRKPVVEGLESRPREIPPRDVSPQRQVEPVDTRPFCGGCGGRMEPAFRTLSSGKTVNYLVCTDSGCNNEQLLS